MSSAKFDPKSVIFMPEDISQLGIRYLDQRIKSKNLGVPMYMPSIDRSFVPLAPGDLCTVLGNPGNGKTGVMMAWAKARAAKLREHNITDRAVVFVTHEVPIEALQIFDLASKLQIEKMDVSITDMAKGNVTPEQYKKILAIMVDRIFTPLIFMGHSAIEPRAGRQSLTASRIGEALQSILDSGMKLDIVFDDYLQRIPYEGSVESKTIAVSNNLDKLGDIAMMCSTPIVIGAQAKREVIDRPGGKVPIPTIDDGQWTSNIEQTSSTVLGIMRVCNHYKEGEPFGDIYVARGKCQLIIDILKQRWGPANERFMVNFDPKYNILNDLDDDDCTNTAQSMGARG